MSHYLHNSRNLHLIANAARMNDVDAAVLSVMTPNGIKDGGLAGMFFADIDWNTATTKEREQVLRDWLRYELQNA